MAIKTMLYELARHNLEEEDSQQFGESQDHKRLEDFFLCFICCRKVRSAHFCPNCSKLCCEVCIKKWLIERKQECPSCKRSLKTKEVVDCSKLVSELQESLDSVLRNSNFEECLVHHKNIDYYCKTCEVPICADCAIFGEEHRKHRFLHLKQCYDENVALIEEHLTVIRRRMKQQENSLREISASINQEHLERDKQLDFIYCLTRSLKIRVESEWKQQADLLDLDKVKLKAELLRLSKFRENFKNRMGALGKGQIVREWKKLVGDVKTALSERVELSPEVKEEPFEFVQELIPPSLGGSFVIERYGERREEKTIYSDMVREEGVGWRMKVYPNGNEVVEGVYLSVFLEMTVGGDCPNMYAYQIELVNQLIPDESTVREFQSEFKIGECWGYNKFYRIDALEPEGYLTKEDKLELRFTVRPFTYQHKVLQQTMFISSLQKKVVDLEDDIRGVARERRKKEQFQPAVPLK